MRPARIASNASIGRPSGLAADFTMTGGNGGDEDGLGDALRTVPADIAGNLAPAVE